jgi:hypothetical protein
MTARCLVRFRHRAADGEVRCSPSDSDQPSWADRSFRPEERRRLKSPSALAASATRSWRPRIPQVVEKMRRLRDISDAEVDALSAELPAEQRTEADLAGLGPSRPKMVVQQVVRLRHWCRQRDLARPTATRCRVGIDRTKRRRAVNRQHAGIRAQNPALWITRTSLVAFASSPELISDGTGHAHD